MAVKPIPEGYHSVTPYLIVQDAGRLLDFVKQVFEAEETFRMQGPGGSIRHAEFRIGDSVVMTADATPEFPPMPATIHLYVNDADAVYVKALRAGATSTQEPADQFYGDRTAGVKDRFGNVWYIATHQEDVSPEELARRAKASSG